MKIAIRGHKSRGKEVIQILESLGGKNIHNLHGNGDSHYYLIDCGIITISYKNLLDDHKYYILEEFEKEFPFKIGDLCIYYSGFLNEEIIVKILGIAIENDCIMYEVGHKDTTKAHTYIYKRRHTLKPYKEMKEERNITLTLDKAKEWYRKGGELKEIALQAYLEEELNSLPKSWDEYCKRYEFCCFSTRYTNIPLKYDALIKLEQLRDCYRGLFVTVIGMPVWCIVRYKGKLIISQRTWGTNETFLSFQSPDITEKYLKNFEPLIKQAGDLI